jgi:hypothetical protein
MDASRQKLEADKLAVEIEQTTRTTPPTPATRWNA